MLFDWFFSDLDWFRIGFLGFSDLNWFRTGFLAFQELAGFSSDSGFDWFVLGFGF
jgi:hypothetical protein